MDEYKQNLVDLTKNEHAVVPVGRISSLFRPATGNGTYSKVYDAVKFTTPISGSRSIADGGYLFKGGTGTLNGVLKKAVIIRIKIAATGLIQFGYWSGSTFIPLASYSLTGGVPEDFYLPAGYDIKNTGNSAAITLSLLVLE